MAVDISSTMGGGNPEILITKDLLGGLSKDLDHGLPTPNGLDKSLDSKSGGKVYLQRCNSPNSPLSSSSSTTTATSVDNRNNFQQIRSPDSELQDLNFPPFSSSSTKGLKFLEDSSLELKLVPSGSNHYQSVCTLEKVKSALQRAEKGAIKKRSSPPPPALTLSNLQSHSWLSKMKDKEEEHGGGGGGDGEKEREKASTAGIFAAGCPGCLFYVITSRANPQCPRCNATVPSPLVTKKPRLDLNASL